MKNWEIISLCLVASFVTSIIATVREYSQDEAQAQEEPIRIRSTFEKPICEEGSKGIFWSLENPTGPITDRRGGIEDEPLWVCNGHIWVEVPNAGVNMLQPWAVFVLYSGGTNQILLFEDGNEASLQARAFSGLGLKSIECVAIYYKGDLMDVSPPNCNIRER